ncbi:hypothetical protein Ndes2437B_g00684 [Nannochloris sp. 'desiccata']|nr:hypothetical protein KSW81_000076 [Chlorella desiccata (nom. nud.)]
MLLVALPQCINAQDGVPPEWLQPIGGGTAAPATDVGGADPADAVTAAPANPGAQIGGGATEAPAATNPIGGANPAVDPNTVPGGDAATAAPATDSATAAPADPNAAIGGTPATTPITDGTDFNTPIGGGATAAPVDPFAAAAGGGGAAAAPTGALVGGPAEQVVVPEAAIEEDDPVGETPEVPDNRPPAPPEDWKALPVDTEIIFGLALDGPYLAPWTKSKSWVFTNVLSDRYLRSVKIKDIETGPLETKQYNVPAADDGNRRRRLLSSHRALLQGSGSTIGTQVHLRVKVHTNNLRVESEVRSVVDGVSSGTLAQDLSMALGAPVSNITLTAQPITQPYDFIQDPNASTGGSVPGWIIGCIVGAILVLMPVPAYIMYKRHKRKHLEAVEKQQAEAAASRQRMQSRIIKASGKSFTGAARTGSEHDILARTGSMASYGGGYGGYGPTGPDSVIDGRIDSITMQRSGSFIGNGVGGPPSPTRGPSVTPQRQLYQSQSLGPGGLPSPNRVPSYANMGSMNLARGAVHPIRGSDEISTSSGSLK